MCINTLLQLVELDWDWGLKCKSCEGAIWIIGEKEQLALIISFLKFVISEFPINELWFICVYCSADEQACRDVSQSNWGFFLAAYNAMPHKAWLCYSILFLHEDIDSVIFTEGFLLNTSFTDHLKCMIQKCKELLREVIEEKSSGCRLINIKLPPATHTYKLFKYFVPVTLVHWSLLQPVQWNESFCTTECRMCVAWLCSG